MYYFVFSYSQWANIGFVAPPTANNATTLDQAYASADNASINVDTTSHDPGTSSRGKYIDWTTVLSGPSTVYFNNLKGFEKSLAITTITNATDIRMDSPGCGEEFFQVGKAKGPIPIYIYKNDFNLKNPVFSYPFDSLIHASSYSETILSLFFKTFRNEYDEVRVLITPNSHALVLLGLYKKMRTKNGDIRMLGKELTNRIPKLKHVQKVDSIISPTRL